MVVSRSEPVRISAEQNEVQNDKPPPPVHSEPATRPAPPFAKTSALRPVSLKGPKGYHVVGSSIWYDGDTKVPPQRPPPLKPKPAMSQPSSEFDRTTEHVQIASAKTPPDVVRRKPTIIRPTAVSSVEQTIDQPASTVASPLQSQTVVTASASSATVTSVAQTNGWNKPASNTQQLDSNTVGHADVSESPKPQPKKRPTIIRMSRPPLSDAACTNELASDSTDQKPSPALRRSSADVSHDTSHVRRGLESSSAAVTDLQKSADHGSLTALGRQSLSQEAEDRDLKPVPRSQSQPLHLSEQELNRKVPPAKPPPPRPSDTTEEQKTTE